MLAHQLMIGGRAEHGARPTHRLRTCGGIKAEPGSVRYQLLNFDPYAGPAARLPWAECKRASTASLLSAKALLGDSHGTLPETMSARVTAWSTSCSWARSEIHTRSSGAAAPRYGTSSGRSPSGRSLTGRSPTGRSPPTPGDWPSMALM